jgi:glyoxylase-like metal-dependent hydrolase (beta-lactamase superfamily II)
MRVSLVQACNPGPLTGDGNNTWLIHGRRPTLIDAGTGDPRHLDALAAALGTGIGLAAVLVTHAHGDHMAGGRAVHDRWPDAHFSKWPWPGRDERYGIACTPLLDGQQVPAGDGRLEVVHTPGHSPDHVVFWHAPSRTLFGGDLLIEGGTVVVPATHGGRLADYLLSLERVLALKPDRVLPAHGPEILRPSALVRSYIAHRRRREAQVLDALARAPGSPSGLAARIYDRLPDALRPAAEESVRAHLVKLQEEGRVVPDGDCFALVP